jgi:hypothetical protein
MVCWYKCGVCIANYLLFGMMMSKLLGWSLIALQVKFSFAAIVSFDMVHQLALDT